jgi:hypothetical protein
MRMNPNTSYRALAAVSLSAALSAASVAAGAAPAATPAATALQGMAPIGEYLTTPAAEAALARSAAPVSISGQATVLVLTRQGYESVARGTNGFTCLVERSWMSPFASPEFWNPKMRGPVCYNPAASSSILQYTQLRTRLALAGRTKDEMLNDIRSALAHNQLPPPAPGAMSFMMSKDGVLGDELTHWHSHLMFHVPKAAAATWGANLKGSPVVLDDRPLPEPETVFLVPVAHWSDGSAAPLM